MLVEILVLLAAVGGSASIVGAFAWLWHRVSVLERSGVTVSPIVLRLPEEVATVRAELADRSEAVVKLEQRVDFLERLLEPSDPGAQLRAPQSGEAE